MAEINWSEVTTEALKYVIGAVGAFGVWVLISIKNRAKRLYFTPESWTLSSTRRQNEPTDYFDLKGTIKFFSKKTEVIALHRPGIELTVGKWPRRKLIRRLDHLTFGDGHVSQTIGSFSMRSYDRLKEIEIPPETWIVIEKLDTPAWSNLNVEGATVWFVADTVAGKKLRWRIAKMDKLIESRSKRLAEEAAARQREHEKRQAVHAKKSEAKPN